MKPSPEASLLAVAYTSAVVTLVNVLVLIRIAQRLREEGDA
jgi:hypothetical protein